MPDRVLILDDDLSFNQMLTDIYKQSGYDVVSKTDAQEALAFLEKEDVALVVADQKMPEMSGEEFMVQVKCLKAYIPVIMISGYFDNDTIRRLIGEGVGGVFLKPVNVFSLMKRSAALIEEALAKKAYMVSRQKQVDSGKASFQYAHDLPFSFESFPCKSKCSIEFANKFYALRNFKSNLIMVCPLGTNVHALIDDLSSFDEDPESIFIFAKGESLNEAKLFKQLSAVEHARVVTLVLPMLKPYSAEEKKMLFSISLRQEVFRAFAFSIRLIFVTHRELDAIYDAGDIDDELYMFMGTAEIRVPALAEIPEDMLLITQQQLAKGYDEISEALPALEAPALATLKEQLWAGNAKELHRVVERLVKPGTVSISREMVLDAISNVCQPTKDANIELGDELRGFRDEFVKTLMDFYDDDMEAVSKLIGLKVIE